ncbi:MFS transporter [Nocardioides yefusunii]|uniref:MFS transporter n=1 Tax=Nocardioides yefusunii TaxID=2500546 RepID=A0ABW1QVE6_9ACTN|nr:MFS transporter [Nocardioides yefusunii]
MANSPSAAEPAAAPHASPVPSAPRARPAAPPSAPAPLFVAIVCALAAGTAMYDQTSLVVVAPTIAEALGADLSGLQWTTALFPLVAASAMPVSGLLGRRLGARTVLRAGLVLLVLGALIAASAQSLAVLLVARGVQGVGGALILPSAPTLLGGNVPDPVRRAHTVGLWMTMATSAVVWGPLFGGLLSENLGWRASFLVYVPVAALAFVLVGRLHDTQRDHTGRLDLGGLVLASATLALLSWSLITVGRGLGSLSAVAVGLAVSLVLGAAFVAVERRVESPLLDLSIFAIRPVRLILLACFAYNAVINGTALLISVHFQQTRDMDAVQGGLMMLVANIGMPLSGFVVGLMKRHLSNVAMLLLALAFLTFAYLGLGLFGDAPIWALVPSLLAIGIGCGLTYFVDTTIMLDHVQGPASAPAMAALALMRQIGTVLGIAAFASIGQLGVDVGVHERPEPIGLTAAGVVLLVVTVMTARKTLR